LEAKEKKEMDKRLLFKDLGPSKSIPQRFEPHEDDEEMFDYYRAQDEADGISPSSESSPTHSFLGHEMPEDIDETIPPGDLQTPSEVEHGLELELEEDLDEDIEGNPLAQADVEAKTEVEGDAGPDLDIGPEAAAKINTLSTVAAEIEAVEEADAEEEEHEVEPQLEDVEEEAVVGVEAEVVVEADLNHASDSGPGLEVTTCLGQMNGETLEDEEDDDDEDMPLEFQFEQELQEEVEHNGNDETDQSLPKDEMSEFMGNLLD
jgi:hypothetical protein